MFIKGFLEFLLTAKRDKNEAYPLAIKELKKVLLQNLWVAYFMRYIVGHEIHTIFEKK